MTKPTWDKFQPAIAIMNGKEVELEENSTLWRNKFYQVEKKILQPEVGEVMIWINCYRCGEQFQIRQIDYYRNIICEKC